MMPPRAKSGEGKEEEATQGAEYEVRFGAILWDSLPQRCMSRFR